jgi:hypothetical protein
MAPKPKKKKTKEEEDALAEEAAVKLAAKEKRALQKESIKNPRTKVSSKKVPEAEGGATDTEGGATDTADLSNKPGHVKARAHYKNIRDKWGVELKKKESKVKKKRLERAYGTREQNIAMLKDRDNKDTFKTDPLAGKGRGEVTPELESQYKKSGSKKAQVDAAKTEIKKTLPQSLKTDKMRHGKRKARYSARLQARATTKAGVGRSIPEHIKGWKKSLKNKKGK